MFNSSVPGKHIDHASVRALTIWHYPKLLKAGVKIYEYQTRFIHAKGALVDNWISIGSCNMDRWTGRWNREANQEIQGHYSEITFRNIFSTWREQSLHLTEERWTKQSAIFG